jgi:Raf kinase inhibitor-like YbhB/YbcL family protein
VKGQPHQTNQGTHDRAGSFVAGSGKWRLELPRQASFGLAPALALVALASCGANGGTNNQANGERPVESATLATLGMTSDAFRNGQPIPAKYTCDGANQTPTLHWGDPPPGTKSFALVVDDPDAPHGTFRHWGVYDIPATARTIGATEHAGTEVKNDMGKPGYSGPCPPKGHGAHHYHFKLFALDVEKLGLGANAKVADVENAAMQHAIGEGELVGTYERE